MGRSRKDPYSPAEEISAVWRGRGEKIVFDNSKCIRTSEGGRGVNFLFPWQKITLKCCGLSSMIRTLVYAIKQAHIINPITNCDFN